MRDEIPDSVIQGGPQAPLGVRGAGPAAAVGGPAARVPAAVLGALLAFSLLVYSLVAADVVHDGRLTEVDGDLSSWVARHMPTWAEWLARPFTWLGGVVGVTIVVVGVAVWLWRRREWAAIALLFAVVIGCQVLAQTGKNSYDRPRPTAGSPIRIPDSFSFPSGHATTGIAVFGLLGLLAAVWLPTRSGRRAAIVAGFALGVLIGVSRVVLNVHFLTDVLAGFALGLAWLVACLLAARLLRTMRRR